MEVKKTRISLYKSKFCFKGSSFGDNGYFLDVQNVSPHTFLKVNDTIIDGRVFFFFLLHFNNLIRQHEIGNPISTPPIFFSS